MRLRCAVIEDDKDHNDILKNFATEAGFEVKAFFSAEGFLRANDFQFDCFLIDWNLPGIPGIDLIVEVRKTNVLGMIFLITGNIEPEDIKTGLESGADDYLRKPYLSEELKVKLSNSFRKISAISNVNLDLGVKFVDEVRMIAVEGKKVFLTEIEYLMARMLYENKGKNVSRTDLEKGLNLETSSRSLEVHIHSLRKKTQDTAVLIRNRRGIGYLWS